MAALNPKALEALTLHQRQLDMDGVEVGVSRQALDELISAYLSSPSAGVTEEQTPLVTEAMVDAALEASRDKRLNTLTNSNAMRFILEASLSSRSPVSQKEAVPVAWRYDIQYGPDGEANYAWVYDEHNNLVCTAKTHHAIAIVQRASSPSPADAGEPGIKALTAADLADAFGCFWNAAIGDAHTKQDSTAFAVIGSMAEGFAAIERRLHEHAALVPPTDPVSTSNEKEGGE